MKYRNTNTISLDSIKNITAYAMAAKLCKDQQISFGNSTK